VAPAQRAAIGNDPQRSNILGKWLEAHTWRGGIASSHCTLSERRRINHRVCWPHRIVRQHRCGGRRQPRDDPGATDNEKLGRLAAFLQCKNDAIVPLRPNYTPCHHGEATNSRIPNLAGCSGGQLINSGEECSQNLGRVLLVVSDDQIDGRWLSFEGTAGHGPR
jgi:hypothetical protein